MLETIIFLIATLFFVSIGIFLLWVKDVPFAVLCFSFAISVGILFYASIDNLINSDPHRTLTIKDIKEYQIDSTIIISGTDTTKTFTITYFK